MKPQQRKISSFFASKATPGKTCAVQSAPKSPEVVDCTGEAPPSSPSAKKRKISASTPASNAKQTSLVTPTEKPAQPITVPEIVPDAAKTAKAQEKLLGSGGEQGAKRGSEGDKDGGQQAKPKLTPLEQQVVELKAKHPGTLLMVEVGYKFRMFGEDAVVGASVANLYCGPDHNFQTCSFPVYRLPIYLRRLTQAGHRIGVVRQVETAAIKASSANKSAPFERKLTAIYTSATLEAGMKAEKMGEEDGVENFQEVDTAFSQGGQLTKYIMCIASEPPQAVQSSTAGHADAGGEGGTDPSQAGVSEARSASSLSSHQVGVLAVETSTGDIQWGLCTSGCVQSELEAALLSIAPSELLLVGPLPAAARRLLSSYAAFSAGCRVEEAGLLEEETLAPNPSQAGEALAVKKGKTGAGSTAGNTNPAVKEKLTSFFSANDQLLHLEKPGVGVEAVLGLPQSIQTALAAAIDHLTMFGQENVLRVVCPETSAGSSGASWRMLSSQQEMSLSANAIRQLEIMCTSDTGRVQGSLLHLLDRSRTAFGGRLLQRWVSRPLTDVSLISQRLDAVEELALARDSGPLSHLPGVLKNMPDLERGITRIMHRTASPSEFVLTIQALSKVPERLVVRLCPDSGTVVPASNDGVVSPMLCQLVAAVTSSEVHVVCKDLLSALDTKAALKNKYEEMLQSKAHFADVFERKQGVEDAVTHLNSLLPSIALRLGIKTAQYVSIQFQAEWLIEVPVDKERLVPKDWAKICSTKKVHRYHPPEVKKGVQQLLIGKERLKAACATAWGRFQSEFSAHYAACKAAVTALAHLDALCALAAVARTPGYTRPVFVEGPPEAAAFPLTSQAPLNHPPAAAPENTDTPTCGTEGSNSPTASSAPALASTSPAAESDPILPPKGAVAESGPELHQKGAVAESGPQLHQKGAVAESGPRLLLKGARHPMLEAQLAGRGENAVPNDITLQWTGERVAIITGPNMGGKSCLIRTAALAVIMAQLGSFVPADSAHLTVFDGVFTRMGASDNLLMGRSTFMEELGDASDIIRRSTPKSLVIMDELGRGTATHDGVAIATATLHYFMNKCLSLFVTHYPEVAMLHEAHPKHVGVHHMAYLRDSVVQPTDAAEQQVDAANHGRGAAPPENAGPEAMDMDGAGVDSNKQTSAKDSSSEIVEVLSTRPSEDKSVTAMETDEVDVGMDKENDPGGSAAPTGGAPQTSGGAEGDANNKQDLTTPAGGEDDTLAQGCGQASAQGDGKQSARELQIATRITFLYKLVDGAADASFGLNVAQMAGLPQSVISRASTKALELQDLGTAENKRRLSMDKLRQSVSSIASHIRASGREDDGGSGQVDGLLRLQEQAKDVDV